MRVDELLVAVLAALPDDSNLAVVRDGDRWLVGVEPDDEVVAWGNDAFDAVATLSSGWWAGFLSYDLGRVVEPIATRLPPDTTTPDLALCRYDAHLVIDGRGPRVEGHGQGRNLLEVAAYVARDCPQFVPPPGLGPWASSLSRDEFIDRVGVVQALIEAGDCYQVNLTRRLRCPQPADPVRLFASLLRHNPAPCAALIRLRNLAVVSASPEWFLTRRSDRALPGLGNAELLRATFPPASVTGAPKPRAMQVIEELETSRRGVYCGAIGSIDTVHGNVDLGVGIRTFTVHDGVTDLGVGAGIVADSDPSAEWKETELKSARLLSAASETTTDLLHQR